MIKASKRRQANTKLARLDIHNTISKRQSWGKRLLRASALACVLSLILWFTGVPLIWHLLIVAASFLAGLLLLRQHGADLALSWIAERIGLSYQTALELSQTETKDTYGFYDAVTDKAKVQAGRLDLPSTSRWWLPLAALAFGIALLPFAPFGGADRLAGLGISNDAPLPSRTATLDDEEDSTQTEQAEDIQRPDEVPDLPASDVAPPPMLEDYEGDGGQAPPEDLNARVADQETLSRFLDNLETRQAPERNPFDQAPPQNQQGQQGERSSEPGDGAQQMSSADQQGSEEAGEGAGEGEQGGEYSAEQQDNGSSEGTPQEGQTETEQGGSQDGTNPAADGSPTEGNNDGVQAGEQNGLDSGANDSAGGSPSTPNANGEERLNAPENQPEFVEGVIGGGPTNLAGSIRLPGAAGESGQLTPSAQSYERSNEQAITEGRIPLEYQDIIRNYFR